MTFLVTSRPGAEQNQDWGGGVSDGDRVRLVVADGATPLYPAQCPLGAAWLATTVGSLICANVALPVADAVRTAVDEVRAAWRREGRGAPPTAGLLVAEITAAGVTLHVSGDCTASVRTPDGVATFTDPRLGRLDDGIIRLLEERSGGRPRGNRHLVDDELRANRALANTPGGYDVVSADPDRPLHLTTHTLPAADSVVLTSDGVAVGVGQGRAFPTWDDLHAFLASGGTSDEVVDRVFAMLADDPEWTRVPRLKDRDDATVVAWSR